MTIRKSFNQQRIDQLIAWANEASIPGMDQITYVNVFNHVLKHQDKGGFWTIEGKNWEVVMTAVVLKALAAMRFGVGVHWSIDSVGEGGIDIAIKFLVNEVDKKSGKPTVGEDVWDSCQAAIAIREFGEYPSAQQMANAINLDWKNLYQSAINTAEKNRWCGPAYLASMVDVIGRYESDSAQKGEFEPALNRLKNSEAKDLQGNNLGFFAAINGHEDMNLWSTSLVLRTMATVPESRNALVDREQVQRVTKWLLEQVNKKVWQQHDWGEAPMFLARALHGLQAARLWADSGTREQITASLKFGNQQLSNFFNQRPNPRGDLKAYTAVVEYLADWKIPAPAGLVFHASKTLAASSVARREPEPREGGLRIVWLSDLHVAAQDKNVPGVLGPIKRFIGKFLQQRATPLTEHFQLRNMRTILDRVEAIKPDHILVTGDLTNYAQEMQFQSVHDEFLTLQKSIENGGNPRRTQHIASLNPRLWTILPGNHDVTDVQANNDYVRPNLGMFFRWFGEAYGIPTDANYSEAFPRDTVLTKNNGGISVRLVGLDSTVSQPVWQVGVNARGRTDKQQMDRLNRLLSDGRKCDLTLVALHHHPIVVPELISGLEDYFLSLKEADGRNLIKLCANANVSAILHGHFHRFSSWSGLTPSTRQMRIIGSPAGTVNIPNSHEEFLELREAEHETVDGVQSGLALYLHQRLSNTWHELFTGVFFS